MMPTYVYYCEACGKETEARQPMSAAPLTRCPACEASALRRVPQQVVTIYHGPGYYSTDNRGTLGQ